MGKKNLNVEMTLKMSEEDLARLEKLVEDSPMSRSVIVRAALRIGIEAIRKDPTVLMPFVGK